MSLGADRAHGGAASPSSLRIVGGEGLIARSRSKYRPNQRLSWKDFRAENEGTSDNSRLAERHAMMTAEIRKVSMAACSARKNEGVGRLSLEMTARTGKPVNALAMLRKERKK